MTEGISKSAVRRQLRAILNAMSEAEQRSASLSACSRVAQTPEFIRARVVMLYLSTPTELDTAPLALRAWQAGKTVAVPRVSWDQRRMLPIEITSLHTNIELTGPGVREPTSGAPIPIDLIDLVIVPALGFSEDGHRIGRGMGFYDRFLAQEEFMGVSCGLGFEQQVLPPLPVQPHDMPLAMIVTDQSVRRFASHAIAH